MSIFKSLHRIFNTVNIGPNTTTNLATHTLITPNVYISLKHIHQTKKNIFFYYLIIIPCWLRKFREKKINEFSSAQFSRVFNRGMFTKLENEKNLFSNYMLYGVSWLKNINNKKKTTTTTTTKKKSSTEEHFFALLHFSIIF